MGEPSGAATAGFVYDGDGKRVKETNAYKNLAQGIVVSGSVAVINPDVITNGDTQADSGLGTSREFGYSSANGLQYVQIDLGALFPVNKVSVWHYNGGTRTYHNTKTQVSADGVTWTTVFDSAVSGEYVETLAGKTHTFTQRSVRYVRDYLNGSTANSGNHWTEIEVWGTATTAYVGDYFEWNGSPQTMTRYYSAAGTRVALRNSNGSGTDGLVYLLGDHLGSASLTADPVDGDKLSELRYKAWGETRHSLTNAPTDRRYTGQAEEAGIGLYYYGARFYDPLLGRFASPDSIIPQTQGTQAWDRYAYVNNSPLNYTDPTGHWIDDGCSTEGCDSGPIYPKINEILTKTTEIVDTIGMVISTAEQWAADAILGIMALGCLGGPEICAETLPIGVAADYTIANVGGIVENSLGVLSFVTTTLTDVNEGYSTYSPGEGLFIGRDTIVAARNALLGLIPESNIDAIVSQSQLKYDIARNDGTLPGGSISAQNTGAILNQLFWQNSPIQDFWMQVTNK